MAARAQPKLPKNYQLIYDIVQASGIGRHLTPSAIFTKAHKRRPGIGFSTVYRGLERLRELGLVSELYLPGADAATYEPSGPRHAHFRCIACGEIEDVAYAIPPRTLKTLALQHGFRIASERVTFEGRCAACSLLIGRTRCVRLAAEPPLRAPVACGGLVRNRQQSHLFVHGDVERHFPIVLVGFY